jgi:hypothetical protein
MASFSSVRQDTACAAAEKNVAAIPRDVAAGITQSTEPVLRFAWVIELLGGNKKYECKLCRSRFTGQKTMVITHFENAYSSQRTSKCSAVQPQELRGEIDKLMEAKKKQEQQKSNKRAHSSLSTAVDIGAILKGQGKPLADSACLEFIISEGLSASIVESPAFRNLIRQVASAGSGYCPPRRQALGLDSTRSAHPDKLGEVLDGDLKKIRIEKSRLLLGIADIGGTLCNDGAKWRKRSVINSTLMTSAGPFYARSTDATGQFKDAKYILDDIEAAIEYVGVENVFIVALDGACKKTLRMIWEKESMHKIFPQRCSTHGCNLLIADIGKLFRWEILMCVRLVKYVCNHDTIFSILQGMNGSLQLLGTVETRFASQIYSSERILADELHLKELFSGVALREFITNRAPPDLVNEHHALCNEFIYNPVTWSRIKIFVDVELPVRTLLRISDGHRPNLAEISPVYDVMKRKSLEAAKAAEVKFRIHYEDLSEKCGIIFDKRYKDIVTLLCLAASMVLPKHIYVEDGNEIYDVEGGKEAIISIIDRYYFNNFEKQIQALKNYQDFRSKSGALFGTPKVIYAAKNRSADDFWAITSAVDPTGCELFRKLVNGYSGQGESERMNKQVKKFRTTSRNRQTHAVTSAYMELDLTYNMIRKRNQGVHTDSYLECLRDQFLKLQEGIEVDVEERAAAAAAAAVADADADTDADAHDDAWTDENDAEAPDLGRDALAGLLEAAMALDY